MCEGWRGGVSEICFDKRSCGREGRRGWTERKLWVTGWLLLNSEDHRDTLAGREGTLRTRATAKADVVVWHVRTPDTSYLEALGKTQRSCIVQKLSWRFRDTSHDDQCRGLPPQSKVPEETAKYFVKKRGRQISLTCFVPTFAQLKFDFKNEIKYLFRIAVGREQELWVQANKCTKLIS